jgi:two-component system, response regulator FlrC
MERGHDPGTPPPPPRSGQGPDAPSPAIPAPGVRPPVPDDRTFLGACAEDLDPLTAVLDLLIDSLAASFAICGALPTEGAGPAAGRRLAVGRRAGGRPIRHPARLIERLVIARSAWDHRPLLPDLSRTETGAWRLVWPLATRGGRQAAVIAGIPASPRGEEPADLTARRESLLPWIALAFEISSLREEKRALAERIESCHRPPAGPPIDLQPPPAVETAAAGMEFPGVIGLSASLREVLRTVSIVARSDAAVLIEGESGTGKELIARAIHDHSARARGPFISESCAACPEGLLESEFFGVERGAFTGAHRTKPGLLERARGGTLFLDEIGEMDLKLQRKLLRALQEREVRRVGGGEPIAVDFRLISATNRVLAEETRAGRFRADLLYRLEVVAVRLPPLRERPEDIPPLARHFLALHAAKAGRPPPEVDERALRLLCAYPWPGNVRELQNEMWRAVALGLKALAPASLSAKIVRRAARPVGLPFHALQGGRSLDEVEKDLLGGLIREALVKTRGNKIRAAQLLGIPKTTLYRRIRRYAIADAGQKLRLGEEPAD